MNIKAILAQIAYHIVLVVLINLAIIVGIVAVVVASDFNSYSNAKSYASDSGNNLNLQLNFATRRAASPSINAISNLNSIFNTLQLVDPLQSFGRTQNVIFEAIKASPLILELYMGFYDRGYQGMFYNGNALFHEFAGAPIAPELQYTVPSADDGTYDITKASSSGFSVYVKCKKATL